MTDKDYIKGNDRNYVILMMLVCFVSGLIAGKIFASIVYSNKQLPIYYISQEEILELEKQRAKDQGEGLFYGKTSEVFSHIESFVKAYEKQGKRVVLSKGEVVGNNVVSLSREVHSKVLEKLKEEKAENDNS